MKVHQFTLTLCVFLISVISFAQIPQTMDYQGMLKDSDGIPLSGTRFMEFRIYDALSGGNLLWSEQHLSVDISDGLFAVTLGETNALPNNFFQGYPNQFITFVIEGEEMSPRQKFNSVPYSLRSQNAEESFYADEAGMAYWAQDADKLNGKSSEDFVEQDASGNVTISGNMTATSYFGDGSTLSNLPPTPDSDWTENGNYVYTLTDSIGIGTSTPDAPLQVYGHIYQSGIGSSVFLGHEAGQNDDLSNNRNVFVGYQTGQSNTTGIWNNIIGAQSFYVNETGSNNNALGYRALYNNDEGSYNTAIGNSALYSNTTGENNLGLGYYAAYNNTIGQSNISIGKNALYTNSEGSQNIAIGSYSSYYTSGPNSTIAIGDSALYDNSYTTNHGVIAIGQSAAKNGAGWQCTVIGYEALTQNTFGDYITAIGSKALRNNTTGNYNTAIGVHALTENTSGDYNTAIGYQALTANVDGRINTAVGAWALEKNTSGEYNTATGNRALEDNIDGDLNSAYGYRSLSSNVSGEGNSAFGAEVLEYATGSWNSAFGGGSSLYNTTGSYNSSFGYASLLGNIGGDYNTAIGSNAYSSGYGNWTDYDNSTGIGYEADITSSNQVRIGNSSVTSIGGYTSWSNLSDGRFKKNVKENVPGLDFILKLKPVTYNLDVDKLNDFLHVSDSVQNISKLKTYANEKAAIQYTGFIAQEVEEAANRLGFDFSGVDKPQNEESHYSLRYAEFVVPLVKAMQEQQTIIEQQNEMIEELSKRLSKLEQKQ